MELAIRSESHAIEDDLLALQDDIAANSDTTVAGDDQRSRRLDETEMQLHRTIRELVDLGHFEALAITGPKDLASLLENVFHSNQGLHRRAHLTDDSARKRHE